MFPFTYERHFSYSTQKDITKDTIDFIISMLVKELDAHQPNSVRVDSRCIIFTSGLFRAVPSWNLFASINFGEINIDTKDQILLVSYHLQFTQLFVISLALITIFAVLLIVQNGITVGSLIVPFLIWLCLFSYSYVLAIRRFSRFLSSKLKQIDIIL